MTGNLVPKELVLKFSEHNHQNVIAASKIFRR